MTKWLTLLLSLLASVVVLMMSHQLAVHEQVHIEQLTQQEAHAIELELNQEVSSRMLTLQQMANRWEVSRGTAKQVWEADAAAYIEAFKGYQALEWVDSSLQVRWMVPKVEKEALPNLNWSREPHHQIRFDLARDRRQLLLTRHLTLPQGGQGFLAAVPVFVGDRFDGFIVGVFEFQTLFDSILDVPQGYNVAIYDGIKLIYQRPQTALKPTLQKTVIVRAYSADWRVVVSPNKVLSSEVKSSLPMVVLTGGFVLIGLCILVVHLAEIRAFQIHQLNKGNRLLKSEMNQRQQVEIIVARLAAIVESSEDSIISKDIHGIITSWNAGAEQIFGYQSIEMIGQSGKKLIPPDRPDEEREILQRILQGERIQPYDTKRLTKDGTVIDVSLSISPIKDEAGKIVGTSKIARNITECKQAEEARRQSEARYRQLINNLNAGFIIHDIDTRILLCNSTACELLGLSMDQILGKTTLDPKWHFLREDRTVLPVEEYPVSQVLSTQTPIQNYVLGINRDDASIIWVLVNAFPEFDDHNQLKQIVTTFINISDYKRVQEEIQHTRNFLQALLDHLPVAVFVKDARPEKFGAFEFWNKTCELLFGISTEQAIGKTVYDFFPIEQAEFFNLKDRAAFEQGSMEDIPEEVIDSHNLGKRLLHTMKIPIYDEQHQPRYLLCFSEDITERKRVEAERREMTEVMQNALSGISRLDVQGRYLYVNRTYAQITGYQPEEMMGMFWAKTVHPDDLEKLVIAYQQMIKQGRVEVEARGIRKDGTVFYKQVVMIATYDEQHQLLGHYGFMKDITDRKQIEINLEQELLRTKTFFNTSMDGVVLLNHDGNVIQASPSFAQMIGYTLEETLTLNVADWDAQWTAEELQQIRNQEVIPLVETRHRRKDGSEYDVEISYSRVKLEGEIIHFYICRDISKRKQAEIDLQISQERFAGILEIASDAIISINIHQQITLFNKGAEQIFGYKAEEVLGQPLSLLMPEHCSEAHRQHVNSYAKTRGHARQMAERGGIFGRRKDGTEFPAEASISKLNLNGEMIFTAFLRDITAQKQAEEALWHQKEMFQAIVNHIPVMITLFNAEGQVEFINPELERVLGWPLESWQQADILTKCYPDPVDCQSVLDFMLAATGKWKDLVTRTATGQTLETSWANVPLSNGHYLGIGQDISDVYNELRLRKQKELALQKTMEAAEAANLAKSIFLANMSHELRTPLNVILGFAQVMSRDPSLTPNLQDDLQTIRRSGDHLLSLINDVLDLSKIESGHCTVEVNSFDLIALLYSVRTMLAERSNSKKLNFCLDIAPEVPQFIAADAQKLRQVLLNLLSNAIKFTQTGGVTLQVKSDTSNPESMSLTHSILQFKVIDTGVGIADQELDHIFDAFIQAQAGKQSVSGTGLGLTISRKLLELMGGKISVQSRLGQGTTFSFTLPVSVTNGVDTPSEQSDRLVLGLAPGQPGYRILVVDDRAENRMLLIRFLRQLGLEVQEAGNGQEAVQVWQDWQPDLTWMDIRMPVMDGFEATRQIRATEGGQTTIIIALTAQASESDRTLALAAGCNDYITKPFREQTLFLKMAEHLGLQYRYAEPSPPPDAQCNPGLSSEAELPDGLNPHLLASLPEGWLAELEDAAVCGNDLGIAELATQLPPELAQLRTRLTELAQQYEFEQILNLIQPRLIALVNPDFGRTR